MRPCNGYCVYLTQVLICVIKCLCFSLSLLFLYAQREIFSRHKNLILYKKVYKPTSRLMFLNFKTKLTLKSDGSY